MGPAPALAPTPNSVAVLYFENLSRDTADAYLADGLTEEVTSRLGDLAHLHIKRPNRNALRRLQDSMPDAAAVGRVLRVRYLVEGSLRREGDRVRVSVRLVRGDDGFRVWGADYNRTTADLLALQEEIARAVATGIAGRLAPADLAALAGRPTSSPRAYEHFLHGNYYVAQRAPRLAVRAIEEYTAAVRLDPGFARAHAGLAYGYWLLLNLNWEYKDLPADSLLLRGLGASDHALQLDSSSSDSWMVRGSLLAIRHPRTYDGVRSAFERAVVLDPGNSEAHHLYAVQLRYLGEDSVAALEYHRALDLEPDRAITLQGLGSVYYVARRYAEAVQWLDSALAVDPSYYLGYLRRARVRLQLGEIDGARGDAETAMRLGEGSELAAAVLTLAEAQAGDTQAARARLERALRVIRHPERPGPTEALFAAAMAAVGDEQQALDFLVRVQPRGAQLVFELRAPEFDRLRGNPRFQRLVEQSNP
ncbi:MAG TPA: hypothetical protein VJ816_10530 [Gemmatimonadales bacterium]|nr:hypothetical protein [Gemmatimonadales bacterium]